MRMVGKERAWEAGREKERVRFVMSMFGLSENKRKLVSCSLGSVGAHGGNRVWEIGKME